MKQFAVAVFFGLAALNLATTSYASDEKIGVISSRPSVSPSGMEVVFSADFDGPGLNRLWIASLDGSKLRKISTASNSDIEPAWSPDGRQIAYASFNNNVFDIWIVQADENYPVKLTANNANNNRPAWSPDGKRIVFVSDKGGANDIWIMNADGTGQTQITTSSSQENDPSFSPTGDKIVFSETINNAATLKVVNVDGSGLRPLTTPQAHVHDWNPHWGGGGIVFSSDRIAPSEDAKIWTIQPDGTGLRKVADHFGYEPVWMRDGRILFSDISTTSRALSTLNVLNPANGSKQAILDIQGFNAPIDIHPGKVPNRINPRSRGKVEVAILSTRTFDATKAVDQSSITFGRTGNEISLGRCSKKFKDVNRDGLYDLRCRLELSMAGIKMGDVIGVLRFLDVKGIPYEGRDAIVTVAEDDADDFKDED